MPAYRVLFLRGSLLDRAESIEAPDDLAAVEAASRLRGEAAVELWRDHRRLAKFRAPRVDPFRERGRG